MSSVISTQDSFDTLGSVSHVNDSSDSVPVLLTRTWASRPRHQNTFQDRFRL